MLISIVERFREEGEREIDRYGAWSDALRRIRDDWKSGTRPGPRELRRYWHDLPEAQRSDAAQDIIAAHLRLSWEQSRGDRLEIYLGEYREDFPQWASSPEAAPPDLVVDEFLARHQPAHGDHPSLSEYRERFPSRPDIHALLRERFLDDGRLLRLEKCGLGAVGEVWELLDMQTLERVALKEPRGDAARRVEALRQFAREAAITSPLKDPGIVHLQERRLGDGTAVYTMRLVRGKSLTESIRSCHQPPSDRTSREQGLYYRDLLEAFGSACEVVAHAHAEGVLHRDLKPGNVVIEAPGQAAILDWGMAKGIPENGSQSVSRAGEKPGSHFTSAGADPDRPGWEVAGTPEYMPPEQADGIADTRSDVFGLGAILYEILTGGPPHDWTCGSRPADWKTSVRQADFPGPRRLVARTPRTLDAICMKALARDARDRHQSADELAAEVRAYLQDTPVWVSIRRWIRGRGTS